MGRSRRIVRRDEGDKIMETVASMGEIFSAGGDNQQRERVLVMAAVGAETTIAVV